MPSNSVAEATRPITLTDAAVDKTALLLSGEEPGLALRVAVSPGGCAGMRYQLYFADDYRHMIAWELAQIDDAGFAEPEDDRARTERARLEEMKDTLIWFGRVPVLIEPASLAHLPGTILDYVDTLQKSGFSIDNPNAQGSCACGDSFH